MSWVAVGLMWAICQLPTGALLRFGEGLGWLGGRLLAKRRHIVNVNLQLAFPQLSATRRNELVDAHFRAFGRGIFETALAWWGAERRLESRYEIEGLEHLKSALSQGGVLMLTGHFTALELGARFISRHVSFHAMYRPMNNPVIDRVIRKRREARSRRPGLTRDEVRAVIKALRAGGAVWYAPDQSLVQGGAEPVPFFGVPALTVTATSRLARMGRAQVVPFFPLRLANGRYRIRILPQLADFPGPDELADTLRIMALIEDWVREAPEQYWWIHRRYKPRSSGLPDPYETAARSSGP